MTVEFLGFKARFEALIDEGESKGYIEYNHDGAIELISPEQRRKRERDARERLEARIERTREATRKAWEEHDKQKENA